jgi:hypothetical protein
MEGIDFIFDKQRLKYAMEYVEAMSAGVNRRKYGVLFTGPNGVGTLVILF